MFAEPAVRLSGRVGAFELVSEAGNTVTRLFCATCGSPLFGKNTGMPGFMTVMAGTLDKPDDLVPQVAIFARSRRTWDVIDTELATFDAQPAWQPADGA
jgi:hypothetical protein